MYGQRKLRSATTGASSSTASAGTSSQSQQQSQASSIGDGSQLNTQFSQVNIAEDGSSENDDAEDYGDMHRLVLQGVMAAGYLDAKGVKKLFQEACKHLNCKVSHLEHTSPPFIQKVVREINEKIKVYDMMIRSATCEITGEKFYVYLVTIEKQVMKFQTFFTKVELELFQKIMDCILRKHNDFAMSMTEAINLCMELDNRGFSKSNAEHFIERMTSMQYFTRVPNADENVNEITLGFRTIREFEPVFRDLYQDCFKNCCLCKMIMLNGLQCTKCTAVIHRGCLQKYIKTCKQCVLCKGPWKQKGQGLLVRTRDGSGMPATSQTMAVSQSTLSQSTGPASNPAKRTRAAAAAAAGTGGEEVDMPILEPMVSPRSAGATIGQSQQLKLQNKKKDSPLKKAKIEGATTSTRTTRRNQITSDSDSD